MRPVVPLKFTIKKYGKSRLKTDVIFDIISYPGPWCSERTCINQPHHSQITQSVCRYPSQSCIPRANQVDSFEFRALLECPGGTSELHNLLNTIAVITLTPFSFLFTPYFQPVPLLLQMAASQEPIYEVTSVRYEGRDPWKETSLGRNIHPAQELESL